MAAPSDRQAATGRVKFPPTLGFIRTPDGMVARLANTLEHESGSLTILFTGERAEIAERLLQAGGRIDLEGAYDGDDPDHFHVDRFDVPGSSGSHSYGLGEVNRSEEIVALDTTSATSPVDQPLATVTSIADRQRQASAQHPDTLEDGPGAKPSDTSLAGHQTSGHQVVPAESTASEHEGYEVGQRVRALDRGNLGTIVGFVAEEEQLAYQVRFVSASGMEAILAFTADQIEPAAQQPSPSRNERGRPAPEHNSAQMETPSKPDSSAWTFDTQPDGSATLALPTPGLHQIQVSRVAEDSDAAEPSRLWEAEIVWVDGEGEPCEIVLVDGSRSQLLARALATLSDLPSFEPYRTDPRWMQLVDQFAADLPTVPPEAAAVPPRWAGHQETIAAQTDPEPTADPREPQTDRSSGSAQVRRSPIEPDAARSDNGPSDDVNARPRIRLLPIHTRSVDPQTGAISI